MQEKYEQVSNLINLGKDRGFLLFDEVNEILPAGEHTAEEIDDLFSTVERNGIRIHQDVAEAAAHTVPEVAEPAAFDPGVERAEIDPDLTAGPLDKASDPVRTYLREMGTVPLLTRDERWPSPSAWSADTCGSSGRPLGPHSLAGGYLGWATPS